MMKKQVLEKPTLRSRTLGTPLIETKLYDSVMSVPACAALSWNWHTASRKSAT